MRQVVIRSLNIMNNAFKLNSAWLGAALDVHPLAIHNTKYNTTMTCIFNISRKGVHKYGIFSHQRAAHQSMPYTYRTHTHMLGLLYNTFESISPLSHSNTRNKRCRRKKAGGSKDFHSFHTSCTNISLSFTIRVNDNPSLFAI